MKNLISCTRVGSFALALVAPSWHPHGVVHSLRKKTYQSHHFLSLIFLPCLLLMSWFWSSLKVSLIFTFKLNVRLVRVSPPCGATIALLVEQMAQVLKIRVLSAGPWVSVCSRSLPLCHSPSLSSHISLYCLPCPIQ